MNLAVVTAVSAAPLVEDLVIEDFSAPAADLLQPGTCICWTPETHAE